MKRKKRTVPQQQQQRRRLQPRQSFSYSFLASFRLALSARLSPKPNRQTMPQTRYRFGVAGGGVVDGIHGPIVFNRVQLVRHVPRRDVHNRIVVEWVREHRRLKRRRRGLVRGTIFHIHRGFLELRVRMHHGEVVLGHGRVSGDGKLSTAWLRIHHCEILLGNIWCVQFMGGLCIMHD
jgi:hypothetical protein